MAVTVYPESCKVTLGEKAGAEEIGEYLAGIVEENRRPPIEVSRTAEDFRNGLYIQMVNADVNRELLKDAVYYQKPANKKSSVFLKKISKIRFDILCITFKPPEMPALKVVI